MLATTGSLSPRWLARASSVWRGSTSTMRISLCLHHFAAHAVAANDGQPASRGARAQFLVARTHEQVSAEGRDDFGGERVGGGIGSHSL